MLPQTASLVLLLPILHALPLRSSSPGTVQSYWNETDGTPPSTPIVSPALPATVTVDERPPDNLSVYAGNQFVLPLRVTVRSAGNCSVQWETVTGLRSRLRVVNIQPSHPGSGKYDLNASDVTQSARYISSMHCVGVPGSIRLSNTFVSVSEHDRSIVPSCASARLGTRFVLHLRSKRNLTDVRWYRLRDHDRPQLIAGSANDGAAGYELDFYRKDGYYHCDLVMPSVRDSHAGCYYATVENRRMNYANVSVGTGTDWCSRVTASSLGTTTEVGLTQSEDPLPTASIAETFGDRDLTAGVQRTADTGTDYTVGATTSGDEFTARADGASVTGPGPQPAGVVDTASELPISRPVLVVFIVVVVVVVIVVVAAVFVIRKCRRRPSDLRELQLLSRSVPVAGPSGNVSLV